MGPVHIQGPAVYMNWLAALEEKPLLRTDEYPLYTDAHIVADAHQGPYQLLNATPLIHGIVLPSVILRFRWYLEIPHPDFSQTDAERYHGGAPPDEIAALASLEHF